MKELPPTAAALQADIDKLLVAMQKAWVKSRGSERDLQLLGALNLCGPFQPLPDWLFKALSELLIERQNPAHINWNRWHVVRALHDVGGLTWLESYERASEVLAETPASGGAETMKKAYQEIEKSLPLEQRRPRTYSYRRKPLG